MNDIDIGQKIKQTNELNYFVSLTMTNKENSYHRYRYHHHQLSSRQWTETVSREHN